jgi:protein phosphatase
MSRFGDFLKHIIRPSRPAARNEPSVTPQDADVTAIRTETPTLERRTVVAPCEHLCAISDVGLTRTHNEDQVRVASDRRTLIVADGMGGHLSGDVASSLATTAVAEHLLAASPSLAESDEPTVEKTMLAAFEAAQARVVAAGKDQERSRQMGSTLILGRIHGDLLLTCHVGDVRGYVWSGTQLRAVTQDHSVVARLVATGQLAAEQAHLHVAKNQVLQAIGMPTGFNPDINRCALKAGDRVLLCSDGLWEMLSDQQIASVVGARGSMQELATQLVDRANEAGGRDNISVILYEHRSEAQPALLTADARPAANHDFGDVTSARQSV